MSKRSLDEMKCNRGKLNHHNPLISLCFIKATLAFTQSQGYRQGLDHESFSLERAKRIMWIEQVLNASAGTINRYSSTRQSDRGRQLKRRTFFVNEENYLVVLNDPAKAGVPFQFVTAYAVMDLDYLRKLKQTSVLIETKKA